MDLCRYGKSRIDWRWKHLELDTCTASKQESALELTEASLSLGIRARGKLRRVGPPVSSNGANGVTAIIGWWIQYVPWVGHMPPAPARPSSEVQSVTKFPVVPDTLNCHLSLLSLHHQIKETPHHSRHQFYHSPDRHPLVFSSYSFRICCLSLDQCAALCSSPADFCCSLFAAIFVLCMSELHIAHCSILHTHYIHYTCLLLSVPNCWPGV